MAGLQDASGKTDAVAGLGGAWRDASLPGVHVRCAQLESPVSPSAA